MMTVDIFSRSKAGISKVPFNKIYYVTVAMVGLVQSLTCSDIP